MSLKPKEIAPCILEFPNAFKTNSFIEDIENECRHQFGYLAWHAARVGSFQQNRTSPDYRSSLSCDLSVLRTPLEQVSEQRLVPVIEKWNKIHTDLQKTIWTYRNTYNIEVNEDEGFAINKYGRGAEYRGHVDHAPSNNRIFSMVAFLNDDFEGGELVFPLFDVSVKPKSGSVILFPSNFPYFHFANSVGKEHNTETKYSLVTWFR